ncbi:MAG: peptidoglycan editing factor PgeF [Steroidobacteraceae bacterium]
MIGLLQPQWPAPEGVHSAFSLRTGGVSVAPYASLNLGLHVGDDATAVQANRAALRASLQLPAEPLWLQQVHGVRVAEADVEGEGEGLPLPPADAAVTRRRGRVLGIMVADCLPVLFASFDGGVVAAAHAGWRGLAAGVLEHTVRATGVAPAQLHAWIGPGIGPQAFEVGDEVHAAFTAQETGAVLQEAASCFVPNERGRWLCDLAGLARLRLGALGLVSIHGGGWCTHSDAARFFSHRRDGVSGRMAALIWRA